MGSIVHSDTQVWICLQMASKPVLCPHSLGCTPESPATIKVLLLLEAQEGSSCWLLLYRKLKSRSENWDLLKAVCTKSLPGSCEAEDPRAIL